MLASGSQAGGGKWEAVFPGCASPCVLRLQCSVSILSDQLCPVRTAEVRVLVAKQW